MDKEIPLKMKKKVILSQKFTHFTKNNLTYTICFIYDNECRHFINLQKNFHYS